MAGSKKLALLLAFGLALGACGAGNATSKTKISAKEGQTVAFKEARLIVETNATDGDAGLQIFLDNDPWKTIALYRPDGSKILDVVNRGVLETYGLTELFSESSEPPFTEFPLDEFKKLFPEGKYRLTGSTIDGTELESIVTLTHDFPAEPKILSPAEDSTVPATNLTVSWEKVTEPKGIKIIGYQVLVEREDPLRRFSADLTADATSIKIPSEFFEPGVEHKVEVVAIEANRNQTLTELSFKVS